MAIVRRMTSAVAPGVFHAPGNPDLIPGSTIKPPPNSLLQFETTIFGQSFARYLAGLSAPFGTGQTTRYDAVEHDTFDTVAGVVRRGSGLSRDYKDTIGTYSSARGNIRTGQPMIYSFKAGTEGVTTFKSDVRTFLDSKPTNSDFMWLAFWHEPDDDIYMSTKTMPGVAASDTAGKLDYWLTRNLWVREVLDEAAYSSRTDIKFGPIFTGAPFNKGTDLTQARSWKGFWDAMNAKRGPATVGGPNRKDTWQFMGGDRYNPAWDGPNGYLAMADWILRKDQCHAETGLPMVIGEGGSARAVTSPGGFTTRADRDVERAQWIKDLYDMILARGYFDAFSWWRVPALSGITSSFSTIQITPTGRNADYTAAGITLPPLGVDAPEVVDVHSQYCIASMQAANPTIPYWT